MVRCLLLALLTLFFFVRISFADNENPQLKFNEKTFDWKTVFDAGFRPKHLSRLETRRCISLNQGFVFSVEGSSEDFRFGPGRTSIDVLKNDEVWMFWHQENTPISLEEGERRAEQFSRLMSGAVIQEMTMPRPLDDVGTISAGSSENNVVVRIGNHQLHYGFDNGPDVNTPLTPHFYIFSKNDTKGLSRRKYTQKIPPPRTYEWYSLDPNIDTPDPGQVADVDVTSNSLDLGLQIDEVPTETINERPIAEDESAEWPGRIALIALVCAVLVLVIFGIRRLGSGKGSAAD